MILNYYKKKKKKFSFKLSKVLWDTGLEPGTFEFVTYLS